jgi:hypothetical protein
MSALSADLTEIRRDLLAAAAADAARAARQRPRRRLVVVAAALALLGTAAAAIAGGLLKSAIEEEAGVLGGHQLFAGSQPNCEPLSPTSFRCTLERPPTGMTFYREDGTLANDLWLGVKAATVDSTQHIDGACVSIRADGRAWNCYLGQEAVERGLLAPSMLGRYQPEPPTG